LAEMRRRYWRLALTYRPDLGDPTSALGLLASGDMVVTCPRFLVQGVWE